MEPGTFRRTPRWLKLVGKLAPLLYRADVRRLLGQRFALLTHRGRHSGRIYQCVVEVLRFNPLTREFVVLSGWGDRADWFRNVRASPPLEVRAGSVVLASPLCRFLTAEETYTELVSYFRRYPWAKPIAGRLLNLPLTRGRAPTPKQRAHLRAVAFRPSDE